ncbi:Transcriptional regulatory protein PHO23 [Wickerhamiella sorbophila]|uniref:Chromatin modification-related protein n=1 Tax=Wickerhamiella sorbophila TaxID=45607 RepID=A0A2T0FI83_9ASCO|nr:Transcriptional regulatory protein PHO23 [Wickerhamiella sorbophila]PRT54695.1 Transcriptional regulatory protein PHO23 [Wickerhamiella sorbophila]
MSRQKDFLRVYPGLNDFGDALEAIPLEMVRHFTLLKEIDAKCADTGPQISSLIDVFMKTPLDAPEREDKAERLRQTLREFMPSLEEKMHVASMAAETMTKHIERINADYALIVENEIPEHIQVDYDDPALTEIKVVDKQGSTRSEARREAVAARRAAAAAATFADAKTVASGANNSASRSGGVRNRARTSTPQPYGNVSNNGAPTVNNVSNNVNPPGGDRSYDRSTKRQRRQEDESETEFLPPNHIVAGSGPVPSRRRRALQEKDEPVYCYCEQGSYGDMVGCDGPDCKREWFHLGCIGLSSPPRGQWFCNDCRRQQAQLGTVATVSRRAR